MKKYILKNKYEPPKPSILNRIEKSLSKESTLIITDDYMIDRYVSGKSLFYVHIKDSKYTKICHYEEITKGENNDNKGMED